jgi:hypothetical protein
MIWLHLVWGNFERCVECCEAAMAIARTLGVPPVQYPTLKALALASLGRLGEAQASLAAEVTDDAHPFGRAVRELGEATLLLEARAPEEAARTFRRVVEQARTLHRPWMERAGKIGLVQALLGTGRLKPAELLFHGLDVEQWAAPIPAAQVHDLLAPLPGIALAEIRLSDDRLEEALRLAIEAATVASEHGRTPDEVLACEVQLRVHLRSGQPTEASKLADQALSRAVKIAYTPAIWRLHAGKAGALAALGDVSGSVGAYRAAAAALRSIVDGMDDAAGRQRFLADPEIAAILEQASRKGDG